MWSIMTTPWNGNIFRVTWPWCGEFTGQWRFPLTKASDAELWYFSLRLKKAWANNRDGGDFGRHRAHYDATVILEHSYDNESVSEVIFETWVKLTDAGPKQYEARYMYIINGMRFMWKLFTRSYAGVIYDSVHLGQLLCLLHWYSVFNSALSSLTHWVQMTHICICQKGHLCFI